MYNYEKVGAPFRAAAGSWFYYKNTGLQNQVGAYSVIRANFVLGLPPLLDPTPMHEVVGLCAILGPC